MTQQKIMDKNINTGLKEYIEPDVTPFIGHEMGIADFIVYAYQVSNGHPFVYDRCGEEVVEENSSITKENLQDVLTEYSEWEEDNEDAVNIVDLISNNKKAFLDISSEIGTVMCCILNNAIENPHLHGEPFENVDDEEVFQEDGPELDAKKGFKFWVKELDGSSYSEIYRKVVKKITEQLVESEYIYENWGSWLFD